jgi:hypothetical protein
VTADRRPSVAGQYPMHRRGMQPQQIADVGWSPSAQHADLDDAPLGRVGGDQGCGTVARCS